MRQLEHALASIITLVMFSAVLSSRLVGAFRL
jgi:hypothetical protein